MGDMDSFWKVIAVAMCTLLAACFGLLVRLLASIISIVTNETKEAVLGIATLRIRVDTLERDTERRKR